MKKNNHIVDANKMIPTISKCMAMFRHMGIEGWVAMDEDGKWFLSDVEPELGNDWWIIGGWMRCSFTAQPVADWKKSKRRIE